MGACQAPSSYTTVIRVDRKHLSRLFLLTATAVAALAAVTVVGPDRASPAYRPVGEPTPIPTAQLTEISEEEFGSLRRTRGGG